MFYFSCPIGQYSVCLGVYYELRKSTRSVDGVAVKARILFSKNQQQQ